MEAIRSRWDLALPRYLNLYERHHQYHCIEGHHQRSFADPNRESPFVRRELDGTDPTVASLAIASSYPAASAILVSTGSSVHCSASHFAQFLCSFVTTAASHQECSYKNSSLQPYTSVAVRLAASLGFASFLLSGGPVGGLVLPPPAS